MLLKHINGVGYHSNHIQIETNDRQALNRLPQLVALATFAIRWNLEKQCNPKPYGSLDCHNTLQLEQTIRIEIATMPFALALLQLLENVRK
jgi:hypothetical protein